MVDQPLERTMQTLDGHSIAPAVGRGMWAAMHSRSFRLYWWSAMAHMAAMNIHQLVQPWYMYELTRSPSMLGISGLFNAIPMLLLSPVGGFLADRFPKKNLLFFGQGASGVLMVLIAIGISLGIVTAPILLGAAVVQGTLMAFMMPARQAIVREIVDYKDLGNAIALSNAGMNINRLMAPAFAGLLIGVAGAASGYYVMAGFYVVALVVTMQLPASVLPLNREGFLFQMRSGVAYVREDRTILTILLVTLGGVILSMPYMALLPVFAKDVLEIGPERLGLLMTVSGGGAVVASLGLASMGDRGRGRLYLGSMLVLGVSLAGFALSHAYWLAVIFIIPVGVGQALRMALSNILIQSYVDDAYRGRVMSLFLMEFGLTSVSTFAVAIVAERAGVGGALVGTAIALVIFTIALWFFVPRLRRLD